MLNLPIKILKTVELTAENIEITIDDIDLLVAEWDAWAKVTSRHLVCITNCRTIDVSDSTTQFLRFNGSMAMDYYYQRLSGVGVNDTAGRVDGANAINLPAIPGASNDDVWGGSLFLITHAFNTVNHKTVLALGGAGEFAVEAVVGRWAQAAAITSVTIIMGVGDEMMVGSTVSIGVIDESYLVAEILDAGGGTFDNIPQGEGDLAIIGYLRSARAAVVEDEVVCAINDDTIAGNYPTQELVGRAGGPPTAAQPNFEVGLVTAAAATADVFGALAMVISQFTKDNQPHWLSQSGYHQSVGPTGEVRVMSGRRDNIEPVNKLYVAGSNFDDFAAGSLLSLYRVPKRIIERISITEDTASITFANIPQNFEALILHAYARSNRVPGNDLIYIEINGDGAAGNYNLQEVNGTGAAVTALRTIANRNVGRIPADVQPAGEFGGGTLLFPGYAETDRHKHFISLTGTDILVYLQSHRWLNTDAITTILLRPATGPNFKAGSVFELEGILRKEGLPPSEGEQWGV